MRAEAGRIKGGHAAISSSTYSHASKLGASKSPLSSRPSYFYVQPPLTKWSEKAQAALSAAGSGGSQDGELWSVQVDNYEDELEIFVGNGRLVESKRPHPRQRQGPQRQV